MDATGCLARAMIAQGAELECQRSLLERLLEWADREERIVAVHIKGSLARRAGDRYSDLDVVLDVRPGDWVSVWDDRESWAGALGDVIHTLEHQWGPVTDSICYAIQYRDGVQLDAFIHCGFGPAGDDAVTLWTRDGAAAWITPTTLPVPPQSRRERFEDFLDLYWMGSLLNAKYIARGDLWMALDFIESRRSGIVRAWRMVNQPDHLDWGWHSAARELPSDVLEALSGAVPHLVAGELAAALLRIIDVMAKLGPELARTRGVNHPDRAVAAIRTMIGEQLAPIIKGNRQKLPN